METIRAVWKRGITETGLKWIALVTMVLDHIHYFFGFTGVIPEWFSMAGRISAPLFMFCLVEGFTHTHNRKKYFLKVYAISTGMSLLYYLMAYGGLLVRPDGFFPANGMMTTFVVLMVVWQGIDWLGQKRLLPGLAAVVLPLAWPFAATLLVAVFPVLSGLPGFVCYSVLPLWGMTGDSSWPVLVMGLVLYLFRKRRGVQATAFTVYYLLYGVVYMVLMVSNMPGFVWTQLFTIYYEVYGVLAAPLMLWYNGRRGRGHKALFYVFYPAHVYILYALSWGLYLFLN